MKNLISKAALPIALGCLILLSAASAGAQTVTLRANIPFQFLAGDTVLPAGTYIVRFDPAFRRVELVGRQGHTATFLEAVPATRPAGAEKAELLFHKYGNAYALRKIWASGQVRGYQLYRSRAEREMARAYTSVEVAAIEAGSR